MGTPTVGQKGTALPTQQTAPTQQAPTQQSGKGAAPTQVSKDTFDKGGKTPLQAPTQASKGVVSKGGFTQGGAQGACETSPTTPTSSEGCAQRVEDRAKHFFAGLRSDLSDLGSEIEGAIDNLEHACGDFANHVKSLFEKDNKASSACSGTAETTTSTCSTQGTQAQGQAQAQAQAQFSKGAPVKGAPTQQAPVQKGK